MHNTLYELFVHVYIVGFCRGMLIGLGFGIIFTLMVMLVIDIAKKVRQFFKRD